MKARKMREFYDDDDDKQDDDSKRGCFDMVMEVLEVMIKI